MIVTQDNLTLGKSQAVPLPQAASDVAGVIIDNHSGYLLTISAGADQRSIPPYSSDVLTFAARGGAALLASTANPDNNPASLPAYYVATWFANDEAPDPASYPATISPPPFAVALALFNQGVPNTILETVLVSNGLLNATGDLIDVDVSQYSSVLIFGQPSGSFVQVQWTHYTAARTAGGTAVANDAVYLDGAANNPIRLEVISPSLTIRNGGGGSLQHLYVIGTNRPAISPVDTRNNTSQMAQYKSAPLTAGGNNPVDSITPGVTPAGLQYLSAHLTGTITQGVLTLVDIADPTNYATIADSSEFVTDKVGNRNYRALVAVPRSAFSFLFNATTTGAGACYVTLIEASANG